MKNSRTGRYLSLSLIFLSILTLSTGCRAQIREPANEPVLDAAMERAVAETLRVSTQLYPPLWTSEKLLPEAHQQLQKIANWVVDDLAIPNAVMVDATISGSIANFNYSSFSDVDLHIFLDINSVENPAMVKAYMQTYSSVWNRKHEISLLGLPVNIFVKDARGEEFSAGIYSVQNQKWIRKPSPMALKVTRNQVLKVALPKANKIDVLLTNFKQRPENTPCSDFSQLRKNLGEFRKLSLEKEGELGVGNLAYKVLRRAGLITRLEKAFIRCIDRGYSIQGQYAPPAHPAD